MAATRAAQGAQQPPLTFASDTDTENPPKLSGLKRTAAYLGFQDIPELQAFWESNLWKPYATHILDNVIVPERARAVARGTTRTRKANFATVEALLEEGESNGRASYSNPFTDKGAYEPVDHYCYAMYHLRLYNSSMFNGLFFGKPNLRPHWKLCLIWSLLQVWFYEQTPSRVKKREEAARKRAAKEATEAAKRQKTGQSEPDSTATGGPGQLDVGTTSTLGGLVLPNDDEDYMTPGQGAESDAALAETEEAFSGNPHATLDESTRRQVETRLSNTQTQTNLSTIVQQQAPHLLTPLQKMYLQRVYGNLADRAHKYDLIMAVQRGWLEPRLIDDQVYRLANQNRVADDEAWRRQVERIAEDADAPPGDPVLPFDLAQDDEKETFIHNQTLLDNAAAQPQGHELACARMGLTRADFPRYNSMPVTKSFKHWQVLAFDWIHGKRRGGHNGVLVCDSMGLGKTWEIVGYMLSTLHLRRESIALGRNVQTARPFLVVAPPGILPNQWANEIMNITNELNIIKYWGELGDRQNSSRKSIIARNDELFNCDERNASTVVITTYHTWRTRHGPIAQEAFRIKKMKWTQERAAREFQLADPAWPHNLGGGFSTVIADEATYIKSVKSHSHVALKWLKVFTILMTATPDINSVNDFEGYVDFIQPSVAILNAEIYSTFTVQPTLNPYIHLAQNSRQGSLLRCTPNQFKRWVLDQGDAIQQGTYLAVLYGDCMIRRSHVSKVDGKMIGDDIPALKHRRAECDWLVDHNKSIDEHAIYKAYAKQHIRSLIRVDEFGNVTWNWRHYRILILLSTWTGFVHIEDQMQAESVSSLVAKGENLLAWIVRQHNEAISEAFPGSLAGCLSTICKGAPKIRALLHIIAHVVVLLEKKLLIFCTVPAQQLLVYAIFAALGISTKVYYADMDRADKVKLQHEFNNTTELQVLIGTFATTSVGINLQAQCHWVLFMDPPPSISVGEQSGGRCHRVGQTEIVEIITLITNKSFNDRQILNNIKKAVPGVVAALNKEAFMGARLKYDVNGDARLQLGKWVLHDSQLVRHSDPRLPPNHGLPILQGNQVIREIIEMKMGTRIGWRDDDEDDDTN